jgi:hypothetical protein
MINNFEQQTKDLNKKELELAIIIEKCLYRYEGKDNAITGNKICNSINNKTQYTLNGVRLRKIINHLRNNGSPICSTSKGYYMPSSPQDVIETINSIAHRVDSQLNIIKQLKKHL